MSGMKSQDPQGVVNNNPPDGILNKDDTLVGCSRVAVAEELMEYVVQKCMGRV